MCHLPTYPNRPHGCYPTPYPLLPRPIDGSGSEFFNRDRRHHQNLPDQNVGSNWRRFPFFCSEQTKGHVIDLNNNGGYDRGRDGVLVFDTDRNGRYDSRDVSNTNDMMKAAAGNYDFNNDGRVCRHERIRGSILRRQFSRLDRNRDGRLDTHEIAQGGGKVWVDKSRGGGISNDELHSPYRLPGGIFERGGRRLDFVDPIWGSGTSTNSPWWQRPGCGCTRLPYFGGGYGYHN